MKKKISKNHNTRITVLGAGISGIYAAILATQQDAVEKAIEISQPMDTIILSPGCSSFDKFANF